MDFTQAPAGTILYISQVQKYGIVEDDVQCQPDCHTDASIGIYLVEVWMTSDSSTPGSNTSPIVKCQAFLEGSTPANNIHAVIWNPPSNLTVSTEVIFDQTTRHCYGHSGPI